MPSATNVQQLLDKAVFIWGQGPVAKEMGVERETVNRWLNRKGIDELNRNYKTYTRSLNKLLPQKPKNYDKRKFDFIDLFAGIGGLGLLLKALGASVFLPVSGMNMPSAPIWPTITMNIHSTVISRRLPKASS